MIHQIIFDAYTNINYHREREIEVVNSCITIKKNTLLELNFVISSVITCRIEA